MATPDEASTSPARWVRIAEAVIIVVAVGMAFAGLRTVYLNDNGYSRLATVFSLMHNGNWFIDSATGELPNPFGDFTVDKVQVHGRMLSSKPPMLPLLMAGIYAVMERAGLSFNDPASLKRIVQLFTIVFGIVPFAAILILFVRMSRQYLVHPAAGLAPLFAAAFGTQLLGYAAQLNNHVPGAALCFGAIYLGLGILCGKLAPAPWRFVLFGLLGGLTHAIDLPLTVFIAAMGVALLLRYPRQTLCWGGLGMLPPLAVHFAALYITTDSPFPVQTRKDLYLYENAAWRCPVGIDGLNEPKSIYAFHLLFGRHGVFLLYPILLLGWLSFTLAALRRDLPMRRSVLACGVCVAILFAYYIKSTNNYGGAAYGFRWAIGAMPILLLMAYPLFDRLRSRWAWGAIAFLMFVSVYSCFECYRGPWTTDEEWTTRLIFGPAY